MFVVALALLANAHFIVSQEVCEKKEESFEDLNSITKCTIEKTEKTTKTGKRSKKLSVKVSSSTRYLKRRVKEQRLKKQQVSSIGGINASGINEKTTSKSDITNSLELKDSGSANISKLMAKISRDQLSNASVFEEVDQIALFKTCEVSDKQSNSECFNEEMMAHIQKHFRYPKEALVNKIQGNVWVRFVIDEDGNVTNLKTLGPKNGELLKNEAVRVISKLPPFKPAVKKGKKVIVKYGFPINFSLED